MSQSSAAFRSFPGFIHLISMNRGLATWRESVLKPSRTQRTPLTPTTTTTITPPSSQALQAKRGAMMECEAVATFPLRHFLCIYTSVDQRTWSHDPLTDRCEVPCESGASAAAGTGSDLVTFSFSEQRMEGQSRTTSSCRCAAAAAAACQRSRGQLHEEDAAQPPPPLPLPHQRLHTRSCV